MIGRNGKAGTQQIGLHAALTHFALHRFRRQRNANRNCLALAKLIFQDAQRFIERVDEEIRNAQAERLLLRSAIRRRHQRRGAGNVGRYNQRAAFLIQFARIKKSAAKARLRVGERGLHQARVGSRDVSDKLESS